MRAISPTALRDELAEVIAGLAGARRRVVLLDGPEAPELAAALVDPLRERGVPALPVHTADFLLPASVRLENGHQDADEYYERWLDVAALHREVLDRLTPTGPCSILPTLWDPVTDRATRAAYLPVPERAALLVTGMLLLHRGLAADLTVHLAVGEAALRRRLPPELHWTLPAHRRYAAEADPVATADIMVRADHPDRPAIRP